MHKFTVSMIVVDIMILVGITSLYCRLLFSNALFVGFSWMYKEDRVSQQQLDTITNNFALIIVPIYLIHIAKVYTGYKMVRHRFRKAYFMKY